MKRLLLITRGKSGFSLIEVLVALSVLSVMLVGMATVTEFIARTWLAGANSTDNFTKARVVLSLLDRDVQMMVLRPDLPAFVDASGNPACAFYTNVEGNPGTDTGINARSVSLVQYLLSTPTTASTSTTTLERLNYGMNYLTSAGATPAIGSTGSLTQLASANAQTETVFGGIIRFQIQFIDGSGTILTPPYTLSSTPPSTSTLPTLPTPFWFDSANPGGTYNPRVVVVSMVVLSQGAYRIATQDSSAMATLLKDFPTPLPTTSTNPTTQTCSQVWNNTLYSASFGSSLPAPLRDQGGVQVFERHIPLPFITPSN